MHVPVLDKDDKPLMPTSPARARLLLKKGRAIKRWFKGVFAIKLVDRDGGDTQPVACGIDPGSKKEAFTVKSAMATFLNIQADAVDWVKGHVEQRRNLRKKRRQLRSPYRANRKNRSRGGLSPSTKSRWQWKVRLLNWLRQLYPITTVVVEDVSAVSKPGQRRWNLGFSPLHRGKTWFYDQIRTWAELKLFEGYQTKKLRDGLGLNKIKEKLSNNFHAHCVDSWVLANSAFGGTSQPDNKSILYVAPLRFHRRQLHVQNAVAGGVRKQYGGTMSLGFKRGTLVTHPKWGLTYVGGTQKGLLTLHSLEDAGRVCRNAKPSDLTILTPMSWRWHGV